MLKNWRLIQTIRTYSQEIGMEFGIEKRTMLIMKSEKRQRKELKCQIKKKIRTLEQKVNDLGILEADIIKQERTERKNKKSTKDK